MPDLPRSFSPSSAGTWNQCPQRWRYRYIQKLPDPPGEPALLGTFAHRVLELLCAEAAADRTVERARELAGQAWPETADNPEFQALGLDDDAQRAFRWRAWTAIHGLWSLEDPAGVDVRATEQRVSADVAGVPFFGIVDRLDADEDGLVITDYKSGRTPRPPERSKSLDQVLLYAAAVEDSTGERPHRARLLYLGNEIIETAVTVDALGAVRRALDLRSGSLAGPPEIPVLENASFTLAMDYTRTEHTTRGEDGGTIQNYPQGEQPDSVRIEARWSTSWPAPSNFELDADAADGLTAEAAFASGVDGSERIVRAWFNYTGEPDAGELLTSYPTLRFDLGRRPLSPRRSCAPATRSITTPAFREHWKSAAIATRPTCALRSCGCSPRCRCPKRRCS